MELKLLLAQLIGGMGIALLIATFQVDNRSVILRLQVVSCLVWALYYFLMGAYSGAGMVLLAALRSFLFERYRDHEWLLEFFIVIYAAMTIAVWTGPTSILPFFGILLATIALWQQKPKTIRMVSLTPTIFWLPYNFLSGSYMGMAGDLVTFTSVLIAVMRFDVIPQLAGRSRKDMPAEIAPTTLL